MSIAGATFITNDQFKSVQLISTQPLAVDGQMFLQFDSTLTLLNQLAPIDSIEFSTGTLTIAFKDARAVVFTSTGAGAGYSALNTSASAFNPSEFAAIGAVGRAFIVLAAAVSVFALEAVFV
jgi:hypothetical protein